MSIDLVFAAMGAVSLVSGIVGIFLLNVLHIYLGYYLDPILFREPYLTARQLVFFSAASWPLTLVKTSMYISFITFASVDCVRTWPVVRNYRKRLRHRTEPIPAPWGGRTLAWLCLFLMVLGMLCLSVGSVYICMLELGLATSDAYPVP